MKLINARLYSDKRQNLLSSYCTNWLIVLWEDTFEVKASLAEFQRLLICATVFKCPYVEEGRVTKAKLNAPFATITTSAKGSGAVTNGGPWATVPELLFEKKGLIPVLQQLLVCYSDLR